MSTRFSLVKGIRLVAAVPDVPDPRINFSISGDTRISTSGAAIEANGEP